MAMPARKGAPPTSPASTSSTPSAARFDAEGEDRGDAFPYFGGRGVGASPTEYGPENFVLAGLGQLRDASGGSDTEPIVGSAVRRSEAHRVDGRSELALIVGPDCVDENLELRASVEIDEGRQEVLGREPTEDGERFGRIADASDRVDSVEGLGHAIADRHYAPHRAGGRGRRVARA
jgi:hypothetical protein